MMSVTVDNSRPELETEERTSFDLYSLDPLEDPRWVRFLESCSQASIFHRVGWLEALRRTYGYTPVVFTTSPPQRELRNGFLCCEISTWFSPRRLVSVPFSDHLDSLTDRDSMQNLVSFLRNKVDTKVCQYLEVRPTFQTDLSLIGLQKSATFYSHKINLDRSLEEIYKSFHKDCVQRAMRRAARRKLTYTEGSSKELIDQFYGLLLLTHKRHGLPPQPISWFYNLSQCLGDKFKVRVVSSDNVPVASIITLTDKRSMVYKYGCSDAKYHNLGGMTLLLWQAIQEAHKAELNEFDMGRTDCDDVGLIRFKDRWGATRGALEYWAYPAKLRPDLNHRFLKAVRKIVSLLPPVMLIPAGRLLYRHLG